MTDTCEKCGKVVAVSSWPFCPHETGTSAIFPDDVPGGFTVENGFPTPQTFYSRSEHQAALAARGLTIAAKWSGPGDKHLSRMDAPCATTLENAKILLTRGARRAENRGGAHEEHFPITVTDVEYAK